MLCMLTYAEAFGTFDFTADDEDNPITDNEFSGLLADAGFHVEADGPTDLESIDEDL